MGPSVSHRFDRWTVGPSMAGGPLYGGWAPLFPTALTVGPESPAPLPHVHFPCAARGYFPACSHLAERLPFAWAPRGARLLSVLADSSALPESLLLL